MGAAHAHLRVLARLAQAPLAGVEVHWVTSGEFAPYSGMLSGWVAGEYARAACLLEVAPLARAAQVVLHTEAAVGLDADGRTIQLANGRRLEADVLCLGVGSAVHGAELLASRPNAWSVKTLLSCFETLPRVQGPWAVVGGGLGGVEVALCLPRSPYPVTLIAEAEQVPTAAPPALRRLASRALRERGVCLVPGRAVALELGAVVLADGNRVPAEAVLWATGPAPHPLLRNSGLALGRTGAVAVNGALQSTSHPHVFAAGDCADLLQAIPKSGVYSVRQAPVLGHNLAAALRGEGLADYAPQRTALALLNCGDGTALLSWGGVAARGRWARRWKHRLDVGFLHGLRTAAQRTVP